MRRALGVGLLLIAVGIGGLSTSPVHAGDVSITIPRCAEDQPVLVGVGSFDHGRWSRYICVSDEDWAPEVLGEAPELAGVQR